MKKFIISLLISCSGMQQASLAQENAAFSRREITKKTDPFGNVSVGVSGLISQPLGEFGRKSIRYGSGLAKYGQGAELQVRVRLDKHWGLSAVPFRKSVYFNNSLFPLTVKYNRLWANGPWKSVNKEPWRAYEFSLGLDRIFIPGHSKRICMRAGLGLGLLNLQSPSENLVAEGDWNYYRYQTFWDMLFGGYSSGGNIVYNKIASISSGNSRSLLLSAQGNISYRIGRFQVYLNSGLKFSKANFKNVTLSYTNRDQNNWEPPSSERSISFKQQYLAADFQLGMNYIMHF